MGQPTRDELLDQIEDAIRAAEQLEMRFVVHILAMAFLEVMETDAPGPPDDQGRIRQ